MRLQVAKLEMIRLDIFIGIQPVISRKPFEISQ